MNKSKNFSGQPIIKQVLGFIDPKIIHRTAEKHRSDKYTKKFTTHEHLGYRINVLKGYKHQKSNFRFLSDSNVIFNYI